MTGPATGPDPEPASVTASRQLASDSRERRQPVRRRPVDGDDGTRRVREGRAARGGPVIRPLGRPRPDHLEAAGSADEPSSARWRLRRAGPADGPGGDVTA